MGNNKVIVGIGEILWDMLPSGKSLGGAPANFAYHAARLGEEGWAVSAIGDDELGREITRALSGKKLKTILSKVDKPTGTVQVTLDENGIPAYDIKQDVAWDNIPYTEEMAKLAARTDAVCFGSLVQRLNSRKNVIRFVKAVPQTALKLFDINLRQHWYSKDVIEESLSISDSLKLNDEEIKVVIEMLSLPGDVEAACRELVRRYCLKFVILTKGADGSEVVTEDDCLSVSSKHVEVVDTVGAGDAFSAAFVVNYLRGDSLKDALGKASDVAAWLCSKKGAMPE